MEDLTLIIPAKNEKESLPKVLEELKKFNFNIKICLDKNDIETIDSIKDSGCEIIYQPKKGYGNALIHGINICKTKYFCIFNADGSFNPKEISAMLNKLVVENLDAVFCSRYKGGAKSPDDTFIRALGNKFFTGLVRLRFGCNITDSLFFYPMFKRDILKIIELQSNDFTLCLELPVQVHQKKLRYTEILSEERERYAGKTKVNALIDGLKILRGIFSLKR